MEARLREDCVAAAAAAKGGGGLPVWYEEGGVNAQKPLDVQADKSFTVRAAYADHVNKQEGTATCEYVRVPIADETAPEEQDFDQLVDELAGLAADGSERAKATTALVFNCHMGRGRTTTGMVCGAILLRRARPAGGGRGGGGAAGADGGGARPQARRIRGHPHAAGAARRGHEKRSACAACRRVRRRGRR